MDDTAAEREEEKKEELKDINLSPIKNVLSLFTAKPREDFVFSKTRESPTRRVNAETVSQMSTFVCSTKILEVVVGERASCKARRSLEKARQLAKREEEEEEVRKSSKERTFANKIALLVVGVPLSIGVLIFSNLLLPLVSMQSVFTALFHVLIKKSFAVALSITEFFECTFGDQGSFSSRRLLRDCECDYKLNKSLLATFLDDDDEEEKKEEE